MALTEGNDALIGARELVLPPALFTANISNGAATTSTAFFTNNSVATLAFPYRMIVEVNLEHGFNGATNQVFFGIQDEGGANILHKPGSTEWLVDQNPAALWRSTSLRGTKSYPNGGTSGFRLLYRVNTSNVHASASILARFYRL